MGEGLIVVRRPRPPFGGEDLRTPFVEGGDLTSLSLYIISLGVVGGGARGRGSVMVGHKKRGKKQQFELNSGLIGLIE